MAQKRPVFTHRRAEQSADGRGGVDA
eukprot:COSAG06_NODE_50159_length_320_cov_1.167421_1_plen_25_part_10